MKLSHLYERIASAENMGDLQAAFLDFIKGYGSDYFTAFTIGIDGEDDARFPYGRFDHPWPLHYVNRGFKAYDACLKIAVSLKNERLPVIWREACGRMNESELLVMTEAVAFGLHDGVVFTFQNQNGSLSIMTVAGGPDLDLDAETVAILGAAGRRVHLRAMQLQGQDEGISVPGLSKAEQQILFHLKHKRSNWEIAQLEGKAENTVKKHRANLLKKLNAPSTAHAVFFAYRAGLFENNPE